jgi:hypothetical protein
MLAFMFHECRYDLQQDGVIRDVPKCNMRTRFWCFIGI